MKENWNIKKIMLWSKMNDMDEPLHKIVKHYLHHSDADDLCNDITGWLQRNYQYYKDRPVIDKICEDIWKSCEEADKK